MIQVRYIGPLVALKGATALAREITASDGDRVRFRGNIKVQFDDKALGEWAFSWHVLPAADFETIWDSRKYDKERALRRTHERCKLEHAANLRLRHRLRAAAQHSA